MWNHLDADAARAEMQAQISAARQAGMALSHIDSHMFAVLDSRLIGHYVELGFSNGIPAMVVRHPELLRTGLAAAIASWEERGLPVFDHFDEMSLTTPVEGRFEQAIRAIDALPAGLSYFILHPACDSAQLRAMTNNWQQRVADYETFLRADLRDHLIRQGIHVIGWRSLRDAMLAVGGTATPVASPDSLMPQAAEPALAKRPPCESS